jgi:hypothetical protein
VGLTGRRAFFLQGTLAERKAMITLLRQAVDEGVVIFVMSEAKPETNRNTRAVQPPAAARIPLRGERYTGESANQVNR